MSDAAAPAPRRARPPRTLVHKLAPIVLGFEAIVALLAGLTIFGLKALPATVPQWWAIVGGVVVAVAMIAVAGMITKPWAIPAGWGLQAVVALSALFVPAILLVALVFGGMWAYATIMGARLDARHPTAANPNPANPNPANPNPANPNPANPNLEDTDPHTESD